MIFDCYDISCSLGTRYPYVDLLQRKTKDSNLVIESCCLTSVKLALYIKKLIALLMYASLDAEIFGLQSVKR
jgi:hypothetical protein